MNRPLIAISMGDPAGIGPEISIKAASSVDVYNIARPLFIGNRRVIEHALRVCGIALDINSVSSPENGLYNLGTIDLIHIEGSELDHTIIGEVQAVCGKASYEYIERGIELALKDEVTAIATGPINKESLKAAHIEYIGHTEILGGLTHTSDPITMFEVESMRIFFLSRHISLRDAIQSISEERIFEYIVRCLDSLNRLGIKDSTLAVAGLNPHCGEHGLFGNEEQMYIIPAVKKAQELGYRVDGPVSADTVFHHALMGRYSAVLSLYHDQGHIAAKTYNFEKTVSITVGLPFLRTSVDHGTAFDIAGTGKASEVSMVEAIKVAAKYAPSYTPE